MWCNLPLQIVSSWAVLEGIGNVGNEICEVFYIWRVNVLFIAVDVHIGLHSTPLPCSMYSSYFPTSLILSRISITQRYRSHAVNVLKCGSLVLLRWNSFRYAANPWVESPKDCWWPAVECLDNYVHRKFEWGVNISCVLWYLGMWKRLSTSRKYMAGVNLCKAKHRPLTTDCHTPKKRINSRYIQWPCAQKSHSGSIARWGAINVHHSSSKGDQILYWSSANI